LEIDTNASPQAFWAAKTSLSVIALLTIVVFRLEGAVVLLDWATDVWATNRVPEANVTVANNAEMLIFQNFIIVIICKYYVANRLINFALGTAKHCLDV
jgi:hypothetical protein